MKRSWSTKILWMFAMSLAFAAPVRAQFAYVANGGFQRFGIG
jgi:hypothetical protein